MLNHGQSYTERGFSVNKLVSDTNMEDDSLIAQRLVYDFVKLCDKDLFEYTISAELRKSCKLSHQRWVRHLEQQKVEQDKSAQSCKCKISLQELEVVKKQKLSTEDTINSLRTLLTH